jgi:phosphohistidine swiveling domain-containing protein
MSSWPIRDDASKVFPLYSRANVGEIFPDPISPLNASAGFQRNLEAGWRDAFVNCGVWDHDLYDASVEHNIIPAFDSYLYINMSLMRLFGVRIPGMGPEAVDLQYFGDMPGIPSYASERRDFDDNPEYQAKAGAWLMEKVLGATDLAEYDTDRKVVLEIRDGRPDLAALSAAELAHRITSFDDVLRPLFQRHIESSLKSGVCLGALAQVAQAIGRPELALILVSGIGDVDSTGPSTGMWALSRRIRESAALTALFDAGPGDLYERLKSSHDPAVPPFLDELDAFLRDWDFRGPAEWEIRTLTWGVKPSLALATIDRLRTVGDEQAPAAKNAERAAARETAVRTVRDLLAGDAQAAAGFEAALAAGSLWMRGRERSRTTAAMLMHELRLAALELGRRGTAAGYLDSPAQIFMLFRAELDDYVSDPAAFTERLRERERSYLALFEVVPPFVTVGAPAHSGTWARHDAHVSTRAEAGETITGVSGCTGTARGRARVLTSPDDPSALEPGEILIAPITDPAWTPLFVAAAAVVVDVGAPFSHAAIVSRELGIPCVLSATEASKRIPDGALIEVNGDTATVTILEHAAETAGG